MVSEEKPALSKRDIRREALLRRDRCTAEYRRSADRVITDRLLHAPWYRDCADILVYSAIRSEVDLSGFIEQARADGKTLYFPKVFGDTMEFFAAESSKELTRGTFGVSEPNEERMLPRMLIDPTPILVPGVAFSYDGHRIGYGKGYYDRYLTANQKNKRLFAIGIAYSVQMVKNFRADETDYPMRQVLTEK